MKFAYLVCGNGRIFPIVFNVQTAKRLADKNGMEVYRMPYQYWKGTANQGYGWDCPTFRICSDKIYPA